MMALPFGMHPVQDTLPLDCPYRPDRTYGLVSFRARTQKTTRRRCRSGRNR
jgi:hypothetical protein